MRVYVIRHGESETNRDKKWAGWLDVPLTEKGKEDARKVGELLQNVAFDKIYVSDLRRAAETAENAIRNCRYETSPLLREINVGTLANRPLSVLTDEQRKHVLQNGYAEFEGETSEEFYRRIRRFQAKLEASNDETVAVFSHAGWLCGMLDTVVGTRLPRASVCCNNCTVGIFEYGNRRWRLHSWINL